MSLQNCTTCLKPEDVSLYVIPEDCLCSFKYGLATSVATPITFSDYNVITQNYNSISGNNIVQGSREKSCEVAYADGSSGTLGADYLVCGGNDLFKKNSFMGSTYQANELTGLTVTIDATAEPCTYIIDSAEVNVKELFACKQDIEVTGFANAANNGYKNILAAYDGTETDENGVLLFADGLPRIVVYCEEASTDAYADCGSCSTCEGFNDLPLISESAVAGVNISTVGEITEIGSDLKTFAILRDIGGVKTDLFRNVAVGSYTVDFSLDNIITNSFELIGGNKCDTAPEIDPIESDKCCPVLLSSETSQVIVKIGGVKQCGFISGNFTINHNISNQKTICDNQLVLGELEITGTIERCFDASDNLDQKVICNESTDITISIFDNCCECWETWQFNGVNILNPNLDIVEGELIKETFDFKASSTAQAQCGEQLETNCPAVYLQQSCPPENVVINNFRYCTNGDTVTSTVTTAGDAIFSYDYGDGTAPVVGLEGTSHVDTHAYAAPFLSPVVKTVTVTSTSQEPITVLNLDSQPITEISLCHLKDLTIVDFDFTNITEADFTGVNNLEQIRMAQTGLTDIILDSCELSVVQLSNNALSEETIEYIMRFLDDCGTTNGNIRVDGGTSAVPNANSVALINSLVAKGWVVLTN